MFGSVDGIQGTLGGHWSYSRYLVHRVIGIGIEMLLAERHVVGC
jgi:hypothetical protein